MSIQQVLQIFGLVLLYCWAVPTLLSANAVIPFVIGVVIGVAPIVWFFIRKE